jgi:hypothetical protein
MASNRVDLSWTAAADLETGVHHYVIYRDGQRYATSTTTSYSDLSAAAGWRHQYQVTAANPSYVESAPSATISVAPVGVASATALDSTTVQLVFTEPMDGALAEEAANYAFSAGITISAASLQADRLAVRLTTSGLTLGTTYTVTVANLRTAGGAALPDGLQTSLLYGNSILWEYWLNTGGTAVADLTRSPNFPFNPSGREFRTLFEARSNWQDNYGGRMRGYLLPATSGDYRFWIASDDNGELWLSTDDDPAHKVRIAYVPGWSASREWTKFAQQQSALIPLVAGQRYYIEALQKEGGGGDNLAVAWQRDGTAFTGVPIPGSFLSPYFETFSPLPVTPTVQARFTNDPTPALSGTIGDPGVAITVSLGGRYYAATRDASATWLLPDDALQPALGDGVYDVAVCATDVAGRVAFDVTADELNIDSAAPTAAITAVSPDPRNTPVSQIEIVFSEAVNGFDLADLTLNRNGGGNLLTASQTLSTSDNVTWVLDGLASITGVAGGYSLKLTATGSGIADAVGNALTADTRDDWTTRSTIIARHVFYNNSRWDGHPGFDNGDPAANAFDDGAIATDKTALLPGQTGTFANYTSYPRGINGIMVDVQGLADPVAVADDDLSEFDFKYGNDDTPDDWSPTPAPLEVTVRDIGGGVHRITFIWADKAIPNKNWLQVTVKQHANTGLAADDVFYFGNTVGENTGDFRVDYSDAFDIIWPLLGTPLPIGPDHVADINRDGRIDYSDVFDDLWPNLSGPAPLKPIHAPAAPVALLESTDTFFREDLPWGIELMWFDQLYGGSGDSEEDEPLQATAVDGVFSVYYEE